MCPRADSGQCPDVQLHSLPCVARMFQVARRRRGRLDIEVTFHHVQCEIDARGQPARSCNAAVIDETGTALQPDAWELLREVVPELMMCGRGEAIEQAGSCQLV